MFPILPHLISVAQAVSHDGLDLGPANLLTHVLLVIAIVEMRVKVGQLWKWRMEQISRVEGKK